MNTENQSPATARTVAQAILNLFCLSALYAAAWTGRLNWSWFLGAVGLSMAWITPALLIQGFQMYARAVFATPPGSSSQTPPGGGVAARNDAVRPSNPVDGPPSLPPGVFGFLDLVRGASLRPLVAVAFAMLLMTPGCSGGSANFGSALDAVWKVVTTGCTGVRIATPLVDALRSPQPDASAARAQDDAVDTAETR